MADDHDECPEQGIHFHHGDDILSLDEALFATFSNIAMGREYVSAGNLLRGFEFMRDARHNLTNITAELLKRSIAAGQIPSDTETTNIKPGIRPDDASNN